MYYYHYYILMPIRLWCLKEQLKKVAKVPSAKVQKGNIEVETVKES